MKEGPVARLRTVMFWATGAALLAGTLHVVVAAVRRFVLHEFIWVSRDFVWMTPLGYLVLFFTLALPVALLAVALPRLVRERAIAFVFMTLAVLAVMLLFGRIHPLASLVVAMAVAVRMAGQIPPGSSAPRPWVPRWGLIAVASLVTVGALREVLFRAHESRTLAALPAAPAEAPNVLLIILDTVRASSMSFMGYARQTTPEIARVASQGATFDHAYAVAPWTLPSHAGIFTARYPSALSTDWRAPLDDTQPTLAEAFAKGGYVTAGFAANLFYTTWESGLTRGFVHFEDYRRTWKQVLLSTSFLQTNFFWSIAHNLRPRNILRVLARLDFRVQPMWTSDRKLASLVATEFLGWERTRGARPFFAFLNLYDAHLPYEPPNEWRKKFVTDSSLAVPKVADQDLDVYDGTIAYMDQEVGRILDELKRRGVLDNTVVVITSDHGEAFGEHGLYGHGHSLYLPELHVPLVIRYPARVPAGPRVASAVSLLDLGATLFDLTGLGMARSIGGTSLAGSWGSTPTPHSPVVAEVSAGINNAEKFPVSRGAMRSLIDSTGHYIRNGDGVEELYDYRTDPGELRDLAKSDSMRVAALRAAANKAAGASPTKR